MLTKLPPRKRGRRKTGDIVKVSYAEQSYSLGLVLEEPLIAFFDKAYANEADWAAGGHLGGHLFTLMVMRSAVTSGRWPVVGKTDIPNHLQAPPKFAKQDAFTGQTFIYQVIPELAPLYERPATREECEGLEIAAVWSAEHVEDRLRDHFAGVPNRWVESMKLK